MKYVTLDDGMDFRTIAKIATAKGYPMNHATARNVLFSAMEKYVVAFAEAVGNPIDPEVAEELLKHKEVQDLFSDILHTVTHETRTTS